MVPSTEVRVDLTMERTKNVDKILIDLRGRYEWVCMWARVFAFVRVCVLAVFVLVAVDLVFQCGLWARVALDAAAVLGIAAFAFALAKRARREARDRRGLAMMIEQRHADLDSVLINAVEFADALAAGGAGMSVPLMKHEVARAEERVAAVQPVECVPRKKLVRERRLMCGVVLVALIALICAPSVYRAIVPRYVDPFGDHPPFSFTEFDVNPKGARVFYGEGVTIRATIKGPVPQELGLCTRGPDGVETRTALLRSGEREYVQKIESLRADLDYCIRGYRCRSKWYRVQVVLHPRFERVLATYEYPPYTHLERRTETVGKTGVEGVRGTKVTLEVISNRPLASGAIALGPADAYGTEPRPMKADPQEDRKVRGGFAIAKTGTFSLSLTDVEGIKNREEFKRPVRLLADRAPTIAFVEPAGDAMAAPDGTIAVEARAEDDYGLSRVEVHRKINQGDWQSESVAIKERSCRAMTHTESFDLKKLGAKPGDVIEYYATAYDTFPGGPHSAHTKVHKIEVFSLEEYQKLVRRQKTIEDLLRKYEEIRDPLREMAEAQEKLEQQDAELQEKTAKETKEGKEPSKADEEHLKDLAHKQQRLKEQAESLARRLEQMSKEPPLYDVERAFQQKLEQMAGRLGQVARQEMQQASQQMQDAQKQKGDLRGNSLAQSRDAQRKAADRLGQVAGRMSREVNEPLDRMADVLRLYEDAERLRGLTERQRDLVKRMGRFSGKDPDNSTEGDLRKMQELAEEQQGIEGELDKLQKDLRTHGRALEKGFPDLSKAAGQLADDMDKKEIQRNMSAAAGLLRLGAGVNGHASAKKALEGMVGAGRDGKPCSAGNGKRPARDRSLEQQMGMKEGEMGSTLEQFLVALRERLGGSGRGSGAGGGEGEGGLYGEASSVPLYGPNSGAGGESVSGRGREPNRPEPPEGAGRPGRDATERMRVEDRSIEFTSKGAESTADEYKRLVEEYFQVVAEEEDE
ncbi:MAG: hypothetical protein GXP25_15365 [Planctomycetes bacterium]|nr:hypothetical protein [Planctomycetota bacterium]